MKDRILNFLPALTAANAVRWLLPLLVILLLIGARRVTRRVQPGTRIFDGKVIGAVGPMGSGKTLWAVRSVRRHLLQGGYVACNFSLNLPCTCHRIGRPRPIHPAVTHKARCLSRMQDHLERFQGWDELLWVRDRLIVVDEAQLYAPAKQGFSLSTSAAFTISHIRKHHCQLIWTSQHESRVTVGLRALTTHLVFCERKLGRFHRASLYLPEEFKKPKMALRRSWYRPSKALIKLYDTFEELRPDELVDKDGKVAAMLARPKPGPVDILPEESPAEFMAEVRSIFKE